MAGQNTTVTMKPSDFQEIPKEEAEPKSPYDPIEELLGLDINRETRTEVDMSPTFSRPWVVKSLSNDLNAQLVERTTKYKLNTRTREQVADMDSQEYAKLIVFYCVVDPNLNDERLFKRYGVSPKTPDKLIDKMLLPGEIERLSGAIMRISGFKEQFIDMAKNS